MASVNHELDARGLLCPMPVIRVQDAVAQMAPGETLEVTCTDPGALNDIPAWCRVHGHRVLQAGEKDGEVVITVEVGVG